MRGKKSDSRARELAFQLLAAGKTPTEVVRAVRAQGYDYSIGCVYNLKSKIESDKHSKAEFEKLRSIKKEEVLRLNSEILNRSANELIRRLKEHPEAFPTKELITTYGIATDKLKALSENEVSTVSQAQCGSVLALTDKLKARRVEGVEEPATDEVTDDAEQTVKGGGDE